MLVLFCTELIEMKANGIFDLLDEESKLPTPKPEHFTMEVHNRNKSHFRLSVCILIFFMFWSLLCLLSPKLKKKSTWYTFTKINGKQSIMLHVVFIEVAFIYYNSLIKRPPCFFSTLITLMRIFWFGFFVVAQKIEVKNAPWRARWRGLPDSSLCGGSLLPHRKYQNVN